MKKKRNSLWKVLLLVLAVAFCLPAPMIQGSKTVSAAEKKTGLQKEKGKYYFYNSKGKKVTNTWKTIKSNGKSYKYYFGAKGAAYAGKKVYGEEAPVLKKIGTAKYGFSSKARMLTGIHLVDNKLYLFNSKTGKMDSTKSKKLQKASVWNESDPKALKTLLKQYGCKCLKEMKEEGACIGDGYLYIYQYANFEVQAYKDGKKLVISCIFPIE